MYAPNTSHSREDGARRIERALKEAGVTIGDRVVTSRDPEMQKMRQILTLDKTPEVTQWQLPITMACTLGTTATNTAADGAQLFVLMAQSDSEVAPHSHDEGASFHFVGSGSVAVGRQELSAGDWWYVPKGMKYQFKAGPQGAVTLGCHCCCCR